MQQNFGFYARKKHLNRFQQGCQDTTVAKKRNRTRTSLAHMSKLSFSGTIYYIIHVEQNLEKVNIY